MINYLKISNLALIEHAELEFIPGFNVITGETGAGKSVLLGALDLVLGGRADKSLIRSGSPRCEIAAVIAVNERIRPEVEALLDELSIEKTENGVLNVRRVITESAVRNFVNDSPVSAKILQTLSASLIDVHHANEHQSLSDNARQLKLLDRYAGCTAAKECCMSLWREIRRTQEEKTRFEESLPSPQEVELLDFAVREIGKINPQPGEDEELKMRYDLAANSHDAIELSNQIAGALSESEDSVADRLGSVYRQLLELSKLGGEKGEGLLHNCAAIQEEIRALAADVSNLTSGIELDAEEFAELEQRMGDIISLKRRYGPGLETVLKTLAEAKEKLDMYHACDAARREFADRLKNLSSQLGKAAAKLSDARQTAARRFAAEVKDKLSGLGFKKAFFDVEFKKTELSGNGFDEIEFTFSANAGEPPQPLRKVASSGELSRLMLAMKTILADADEIESVIFDEIDVNIGGETAKRVGEELKRLGKTRQILAISHLPQVAARGDAHFLVSKSERGNRTYSNVEFLAGSERSKEIARMLGGDTAASQHAAELLKDAGYDR